MFHQPDLWSSSNYCAAQAAKHFINKHKNLLKFKKDECILDVGTGDGRTTITAVLPNLPKNLKEIVLSDKSKVMLDYAKKREEFSNMQFEELDIGAKTIPRHFGNRFDHIMLISVLHCLQDPKQALQNVYDMLKPGGAAFGIILTETPKDEAIYTLSKSPKWSMYEHEISPYYNNPRTVEIYRKNLDDCGFVNCCLEPEVYVHEFANEEEYRNLLTSVCGTIQELPEDKVDEYLEEYFQVLKNCKIFSYELSEDGEIINHRVNMPFVALYAEKPTILK